LNKVKRLLYRVFRGHLPYTREQLIKYGARVGKNFYNGAEIDRGHAFLLTIGDDVTLSACRILLHDASTKRALGYSRVGRVEIGNNVFVGAGAIILPNVKIGSNVVIGAGSVVSKDVPSNSLAVGVPCVPIKTYDEFISENRKMLGDSLVFNTACSDKTKNEINQEYNALKDGGIGFDI